MVIVNRFPGKKSYKIKHFHYFRAITNQIAHVQLATIFMYFFTHNSSISKKSNKMKMIKDVLKAKKKKMIKL